MPRSLIPNSTQIPDVILDEWMAKLTDAELRVVLYVARRTFGFGRAADTISLQQMAQGITRRDGTRLDSGTGLSLASVKNACRSLAAAGVLKRTQRLQKGGDEFAQSLYALNLQAGEALAGRGKKNRKAGEGGQRVAEVGQPLADPEPPPVGQPLAGVGQREAGGTAKEWPAGRPLAHPLVGQRLAPQETEGKRQQETVGQETGAAAETGAAQETPVPAAAGGEDCRDEDRESVQRLPYRARAAGEGAPRGRGGAQKEPGGAVRAEGAFPGAGSSRRARITSDMLFADPGDA